MKKGSTSKRYSEAFKRQVVLDLKAERVTIPEVRRRYGISGAMTIKGWLKRYGGKVKTAEGRRGRPRSEVTARVSELERERRSLEQAVARLTVEKIALQALMQEAEEHYGEEFRRNFGTGR